MKNQRRNEIAVCVFDFCSENHVFSFMFSCSPHVFFMESFLLQIFSYGIEDDEMDGIEREQFFYPSHLLLLFVGSRGVGRSGAVSGQ